MKWILVAVLLLILIIPVSADTLIKFVDHDGYMAQTTDANFLVIRLGAGELVVDGGATLYGSTLGSTTNPKMTYTRRAGLSFNGSAMGLVSGDTITDAILTVKSSSKSNAQGEFSASLIDFTPANPMDYVAGDFDGTTFTKKATDISYASWSTTALNNFTLNTGYISKTGWFSYILTHRADADAVNLTWGSSVLTGFYISGMDDGTNDAFITITYTAGGGGDTTPPDAISNLASTQTCSSINVTWTNPTTADFNHTYSIWQGSWFGNLTNTTTFNNFTGLSQSTVYSFNTSTVDLAGNMNRTHWMNISATTNTCIAPVSSFTPLGTTTGTAPLFVQFNDTSTNTPTAWYWGRNNLTHATWEQFNTTRNASQTFVAGNWSVNLTASNTYGSNISTQVSWVNVTNPVPVSAFSVNATVGITYGMHVAFTDLSTGSPVSWYWDFGDGGTSTLQNPIYIYDVSRYYNVSLKVTNSYGEYDWENKTDYINLQSDLPNVGAWSHFDGANGGTTFIDEIGSAISSSGATTSSAQLKFGNASLLTNTAGSYISTPNSTRNWFGNSAFTLEGWMYPTSTGAGNQLWQSKTNKFLSQGWGLYHGSASATSNDWRFFMGDSAVNSTDAFTIPLNTWTHVAIQRYTNGTVFIYLNGNYTTSKAMIGSYDTSNPYRIGRQDTGSVSNSFIGYTDEARGSDVVRWYANFTPPTEAYRNGQTNPDTNPLSTLRFKTDPVSTASITNQTNGGVRNRTIQIQNVNAVSYIVGSMTFDQEHLLVKNVYLNKTVWGDTTLVSSDIRNDLGYLEFNVSRAGGFSPDTTRSSFLDTEMLYYNYTPAGTSSSSFFGYGVVINQTTGTSYPIHNFIETVLTYVEWDFAPDFTADVTTGNAPLTVTFTDTTIGYPNRWDWDFGDGEHTNWTTQNPVHVYANPGLYTVSLNETIWQNTSVMNSTTKIAYITVNDGTPPNAISNLASTQTCSSINYTWTNPTTADFNHTYVMRGNTFWANYTNSTTFTNWTGLTESTAYSFNSSTVDITGNMNKTHWQNLSATTGACGVAPVASFTPTGTTEGTTPKSVTFTDTSTNTPTGWQWGRNNLTHPTWTQFNTTHQNPIASFWIGNWSVNLTSSNAYGSNISTQLTWINVSKIPTPPVAAFSANTTAVCMGTEFRDYVQFTDESTNTPTSWFWLFGNAGVDSHLQNPVTNTFDTVGAWDVKLQATNADGNDWENKTGYITVSDCTPGAAFTYIPHEGMEPLSVQFTDTSTHTPTGWGWFFQDKTGNDTIIQFSTLTNPLKIFNAGNFTIKLNATNLYGSNVTPANPYVNVSVYVAPLLPPVAAFAADDTSVCLNGTVTFTDLSTNTPLSWLWEFGDGNTSILQSPSNAYYTLGTFTVNMRATNADGFDWENKTNYITVNECLPPTPTPTPKPYCSFVNMTNVTIAHNSTSWVLGSGATFWGMEIINESEGNVSYYTCGADTIVSGGGGSDSGAALGAVFGIGGGLIGAILYIRKRRQEEEEGLP